MPTISETDATAVADFMVDDFWGTGSLAFDVGPGDTIYVDILALSADGQALAKAALALWASYTGINFVYGDYDAAVWNSNFTQIISYGTENAIIFDDNQSGAFAGPNLYLFDDTASGADNTIWNSSVNVSTAWLSAYGTTIDSYSFQTYVHEIGHALGLGHAGPYDGSATYGVDNRFAFDSWQMSIMSYFSQTENTSITASYAFILSPMMADIIAIQRLYGTAGNLRTGNDTYSYDTATLYSYGSDVAALIGSDDIINSISMTILDDGGQDTFDFSDDTLNQVIDLRGGGVSSVYGLTGNIVIFFSTVIENAMAGSGSDTVYGNGVANNLNGGLGNDTLFGYGGHDTLIGGGGADTMVGGTGNDRYYVDSAGDVVTEFAAEGIDIVYSSISFALRDHGQNIENLSLTGVSSISGTGNGKNNTIIGNAGNNLLNGALGDDLMFGGAGNDTFLDDGGKDRMVGGRGNDKYYVDNLGDTVVEIDGQGVDIVYSSVNFSLRNNSQYIENLTLTGAANITGIGNGRDNVIVGNIGNNVLNGALGNDVLAGGAGNDTFLDDGGQDQMIGGRGNDKYYVDNAGDTVIENDGQGKDIVYSSVAFSLRAQSQYIENLTLTGAANVAGTGNGRDNVIVGNIGNNVLNGALGNDVLAGGAGNDTFSDDGGNDTMIGGGGADTFIFAGNFGNDVISDFNISEANERIDLSGVVSITDYTDLVNNHMTQSGSDVLIADGSGNYITLEGINLTDLGSDDFIF